MSPPPPPPGLFLSFSAVDLPSELLLPFSFSPLPVPKRGVRIEDGKTIISCPFLRASHVPRVIHGQPFQTHMYCMSRMTSMFFWGVRVKIKKNICLMLTTTPSLRSCMAFAFSPSPSFSDSLSSHFFVSFSSRREFFCGKEGSQIEMGGEEKAKVCEAK